MYAFLYFYNLKHLLQCLYYSIESETIDLGGKNVSKYKEMNAVISSFICFWQYITFGGGGCEYE